MIHSGDNEAQGKIRKFVDFICWKYFTRSENLVVEKICWNEIDKLKEGNKNIHFRI